MKNKRRRQKLFSLMDVIKTWTRWQTSLSGTPCLSSWLPSDFHDRQVAYRFSNHVARLLKGEDGFIFHFSPSPLSSDAWFADLPRLSVLLYLDYCLFKYGALKWVWAWSLLPLSSFYVRDDLDLLPYIVPLWRSTRKLVCLNSFLACL